MGIMRGLQGNLQIVPENLQAKINIQDWNVTCENNTIKSVDFTHDVSAWHHANPEPQETDKEIIENPVYVTETENVANVAKHQEQEAWHSQHVYDDTVDEGKDEEQSICFSQNFFIICYL